MDTARQPAGVPVGGQFAATTHAEPGVSLVSAAAQPGQYNPDRHALLMSQTNIRHSAMDRLLKEQDKLSMEAAKSGILRDYPTATELRIKQNFGRRGERFNSTMASVRDQDGTNLTEDTKDWDYRGGPNGEQSILRSFSDVRSQFFDYENDFAYDAGEIIIPLDRDYAEGVNLI